MNTLEERLEPVFRKYPDVLAVYLFGSHATGKANRESDLDLAVLPRNSAAREQKLDLLTDLARAGFCNVDLVFLDVKDTVLRHEAVRLNNVVYQSDEFDRGATYSRIVREYLDFLPMLKIQREAFLARERGK